MSQSQKRRSPHLVRAGFGKATCPGGHLQSTPNVGPDQAVGSFAEAAGLASRCEGLTLVFPLTDAGAMNGTFHLFQAREYLGQGLIEALPGIYPILAPDMMQTAMRYYETYLAEQAGLGGHA